jgi:hypothetical protein
MTRTFSILGGLVATGVFMLALTVNRAPSQAAALTVPPTPQTEVVAIPDPEAQLVEDLASWPAAAGR